MAVARHINRLRLRAERQSILTRGVRRQVELRPVARRTDAIKPRDILLFATLRNESVRLPYFLEYYRRLGVSHFIIVDNGSTDGSGEYLAGQTDVSLWHTTASYKRAKFGMDWLNGLLTRFGHEHWVVVVDVDEFLIYPYWETRPLGALTDWLESCRLRSFGTMLLDMYADVPVSQTRYVEGQDPFEILTYFDAANYAFQRNGTYRDLWIQGGPRERAFFSEDPAQAPALNKIPLVKWRRGMVYRSSTHTLMPRGLNQVYAERGGERICGVLLHAKFLDVFASKAEEELARGQHYAASREYRVYDQKLSQDVNLWTPESTRFRDWRQLDELGLMSSGSWA
ncbi:MAG: glycosyltransferase family 2 protein [Pseudomonadota bacterium]